MIQVINRAFDILEIVAQDLNKEYSLKEIAEKLALNHSTCANILKTMVNRGYIESLGKKKGYRLGRTAYYLTNNVPDKIEIIEASVGPVRELKNKINESIIVSVLRGNVRVTILKETCTHDLQANTPDEKNVYLTATGRMLLACMNEVDREQFIKNYGLPKKAWNEVKNKENLLIEFNKIKKEQIAIHHADSDIIGIAMPINKKGKIIASLGVYLPEIRFKYKKQIQIITEMKRTVKQINDTLLKSDKLR